MSVWLFVSLGERKVLFSETVHVQGSLVGKATHRREELYRSQLPSVRPEETVRERGRERERWRERELSVVVVVVVLLLLLLGMGHLHNSVQ